MRFSIKKNILVCCVRAFFYSLIASSISGITMALLNILLEITRGSSLFKFKDSVQISLGYIAVWIMVGIILGTLYSSYLLIRKKIKVMNLPSLTYLYVFLAIWLLVFGYINNYHLPLFMSVQSVIWNIVIMTCGVVFFIFLIKLLTVCNLKFFFKLHVSILILTFVISFIFSLNLPGKKERKALNKGINSNSFNVIILLLDAVRSDHLSCYGYKRKTTPNIDRLAKRGVIFENAYATSSHTKESTPSIFTSTYPSTHKVKTLSSALPRKILTLPQIFQLLGYKTAFFSANAVVSESYGYDKGVDDYFGQKRYILGNTILISLIEKLSEFQFPILGSISNGILELIDSLFKSKGFFHSGDPKEMTKTIMSWISDNHDKPFFIYTHYSGGHAPYNPPQPYDRMFDPDFPKDPIANFPRSRGIFLPFVEGEAIPQRDLENMIAQYDGEIFYHDKSLGLLFNHLRKLGLDRNTIIVITADHGEEFYEHKGWNHGHSLFEETIHVPLIFYGPGVIPESGKITNLVSLVDIFPTLLNLCGISGPSAIPYRIEGFDLSPFFSAKNYSMPREYIFAEVYLDGGLSAKCIRTKKYKAILAKFGSRKEQLLFDLVFDPFEKNNIFEKERKRGENFIKQINALVEEAEKKSFESKTIDIDEKLKEKLKSLGYIR